MHGYQTADAPHRFGQCNGSGGGFFEIFDDQRRNSSRVDLLIRAQHNRKTMGENKLFEEVMQSPIQSPDNHKDSPTKRQSQKEKSESTE